MKNKLLDYVRFIGGGFALVFRIVFGFDDQLFVCAKKSFYSPNFIFLLCSIYIKSINTLLQGAYFTAVDLAALARELDEQEKAMMEESGKVCQRLQFDGYFIDC